MVPEIHTIAERQKWTLSWLKAVDVFFIFTVYIQLCWHSANDIETVTCWKRC